MTYTPTSWVDFPSTSTPITAARLNNMESGIMLLDPFPDSVITSNRVTFSAQMANPPVSGTLATLQVNMTSKGTGVTGEGSRGLSVLMQDSGAVVNKAITGAANNGSGLIRITCVGHTFATSDRIAVYGVGGTTEANGKWTITVITSDTFDLQGSAFSNTYTSGGTATNRPYGNGIYVGVAPTISRGGLTGTASNGDDLNGVAVQNGSATAKATDAFYIATSPVSGPAWDHGFCCDADIAVSAVQFNGDLTGAAPASMIDLGAATASGGGYSIRLPNSVPVAFRNGADNGDVWAFYLDSNNALQLFVPLKIPSSSSVTFGDGTDMNCGTTTGTKIGTSTSQKLGLWNATPIVRPSSTGETTGFTAGAGTGVKDDSTFTGNVGSTAYRISDIVKHLKNIGLIAS